MSVYLGSKCQYELNVGNKQVDSIYLGRSIVWPSQGNFITKVSEGDYVLDPGIYHVVLRATGGQGGYGTTSTPGGAGGAGEIKDYYLVIPETTVAHYYLGGNGTNGGAGGGINGAGGGGESHGCMGGAGAYPTYVKVYNTYLSVLGGAGGGGAGGNATSLGPGAGGGGGGYYSFDNGTITSISGQIGGNSGTSGSNGVRGNQAFSQINSGQGGLGNDASHSAGAKAVGGGASGGGGSAGRGTAASEQGGGGGGAAGDPNAKGGAGGTGYIRGTNATNATYIPVDTAAENAIYGIIGTYGMGSEGGHNSSDIKSKLGQTGFILIQSISGDELLFPAGTYHNTIFPKGSFEITLRGGGGAGGQDGQYVNAGAVGTGGVGGKGDITSITYNFDTTTILDVRAGRGGYVGAAGNGGRNGTHGNRGRAGTDGGGTQYGGGGGLASYIKSKDSSSGTYALGGGGGGGGGESAQSGRYTGGNGGGGGGGFYKLVNYIDVSVPGQPGRGGGTSGDTAIHNGYDGNLDFPEIYAGNGGWGYRGGQGTGGIGGGASGAASGTGKRNDDDWRKRHSGGGGGGAGGCPDASGGSGGTGASKDPQATSGSNFHTIPTNTTIENSLHGVIGNYGEGGLPNQNGQDGYIKVKSLWLPLPVDSTPSYNTEVLVASVSGSTNTIYTVPSNGFYRVEVQGSGGGAAYKGSPGVGGKTSQIVYLYEGTKCLLWGSAINTTTGYPSPTNDLGGRGGYIPSGSGQTGGAGGGAAGTASKRYSVGGGGAGFLAGIDKPVQPVSHSEPEWVSSITSEREWTVGNFSVQNLYCYVLCGGGGGACSDEHEPRASGGGGGAFGNGGDTGNGKYQGIAGPGGTWGKGGNGGYWASSPGGQGAWAILDFSRNQFTYGLGGGSRSNGYCNLYKLS